MEDFAVAFALLEGGALEGEALEGFDLGEEWTGEESIEGVLEGGRFFGYGAFGFPEARAEDFFTEIAEVVEGKLEEAIGRGIEGIEAAFFAEIFGDEPLVGVVPAAPVAEGVAEKERWVGIAGGFPRLFGLEAGVGISLDGFEVEFETIGAEHMAKEEELFEEGLGFFCGVRGEINRCGGAPFEQELLAFGADGLDHRTIFLFVIEFWGGDFEGDAEWRVTGDRDLDPSGTEKVDEAEAAGGFSSPPEVGVGGLFEAGGDGDIGEMGWAF